MLEGMGSGSAVTSLPDAMERRPLWAVSSRRFGTEFSAPRFF